VGTCDLEPFLDSEPPSEARPDVVRFTSLFGGSCAGLEFVVCRMGVADEPFENVKEGESGPMLDLGLPLCCEVCIVDNLFIQEPLEDTESFRSSSVYSKPSLLLEVLRPPFPSSGSFGEALLLVNFGSAGVEFGKGEELEKGSLLGVRIVELVAGREGDIIRFPNSYSVAFLLFEEGLGGVG
jgi:hypothetical protein